VLKPIEDTNSMRENINKEKESQKEKRKTLKKTKK
jgi:hypothetical protein